MLAYHQKSASLVNDAGEIYRETGRLTREEEGLVLDDKAKDLMELIRLHNDAVGDLLNGITQAQSMEPEAQKRHLEGITADFKTRVASRVGNIRGQVEDIGRSANGNEGIIAAARKMHNGLPEFESLARKQLANLEETLRTLSQGSPEATLPAKTESPEAALPGSAPVAQVPEPAAAPAVAQAAPAAQSTGDYPAARLDPHLQRLLAERGYREALQIVHTNPGFSYVDMNNRPVLSSSKPVDVRSLSEDQVQHLESVIVSPEVIYDGIAPTPGIEQGNTLDGPGIDGETPSLSDAFNLGTP